MDDQRANRESGEGMGEEFSPKSYVGATHDVGEAHKPVNLMIRIVMPSETNYGLGVTQISGWIFMTGEEGEDTEATGIYELKRIIDHNPEIIPYLTTPAPCRLERDGDLPVFLDVTDEHAEED
jgi:hypothetical protein